MTRRNPIAAAGLVSLCACLLLLPACTFLDGPTAGGPVLLTLSASPQQGTAPLTVGFHATSADGEPCLSYAWDFDETGEELQTTANPSTTHRFARSGEYTVRVTGTDAQGQATDALITVVVENAPPTPSLRMSDDAPVLGEEVLFDATGSIDGDGQVVHFSWAFGDGATAEGPAVRHAYTRLGQFLVRLTITDNEGATATLDHEMTVVEYTSGGCTGGGGVCL